MSKHNVLTIPPELTEHIALLADPEDLLSLRLVNREASQRIEQVYIKAYFTECAFLLCYTESLATLLAIVEHDKYGASLERIVICVDQVSHPEQQCRLAPGAKKDRRSKAHKAHVAAYAAQTFMQQDNIDIALLTLIFTRLRQHANVQEITITDIDTMYNHEPLAWGYNTFREEIGDGYTEYNEDESRPVRLILDALVTAQLPVSKFEVNILDGEIPMSSIVATPRDFNNTRSVFRNLTVLSLQVRIDEAATTVHYKRLASAIGDATGLQELHLDAGRDWEDTERAGHVLIPRRILRHRFPSLKTLNLSGFVLDCQQLIAFLSRHRQLERVFFDLGHFFNTGDSANMEDGRASDVEELLKKRTGLSWISLYQCETLRAEKMVFDEIGETEPED